VTATTAHATAATDALGPVRDALLARARADAAAEVARAEEDARRTVQEAGRRADAVRAEARARGEADAHAVLTATSARCRREARSVVLGAQRAVSAALRERVHAGLPRLREDPAFPAMERRLEAQARELLGPDARLTRHPSGGFLAESRGRRAELTLAAVADRELDRLGPELQSLWSR
jgi:vacuolar-type H+-ATPase subunit E/Vma4